LKGFGGEIKTRTSVQKKKSPVARDRGPGGLIKKTLPSKVETIGRLLEGQESKLVGQQKIKAPSPCCHKGRLGGRGLQKRNWGHTGKTGVTKIKRGKQTRTKSWLYPPNHGGIKGLKVHTKQDARPRYTTF